ncbi:hypothetical protein COTS27_01577 [Spirochaetota bacterium]|nr:hypothetical protein COTS27_01577 [Spirochaetota bacterium]
MLTFIGPIFLLLVSIIAISIFFYFVPIKLWIEAMASGAYVGILKLIGMRLRGMSPAFIVRPYISARKADIDTVKIDELEAHYLAIGSRDPNVGTRLEDVVVAVISANRARLDLTPARAMSIDLAGRNVRDAVNTSVLPRIIETPKIAAVAKDGIQVIALARITVRTNLERLVGGAGEETILARVGEGIVTTIGSALTHKNVLENPDAISQTVLTKGLDSGTAFEILSIDIADVDIGKNVGAALQTDQAEADKKIAQAKAEERRAMAIALEQEMKARVEEFRAELVKAEAAVPKAIAGAFDNGRLGIMDYYRLENVKADTSMRSSLADSEPAQPKNGDS